jgi:crossover junction endodeoxyribonuclease RusA
MFVKQKGLDFRKAVAEIVAEAGHPTLTGRVSLFAAIHPATRAKQDLDNRSKALQDALAHAGVFLDDEQIDELHLVRREVIKGGMVRVVITELKEKAA